MDKNIWKYLGILFIVLTILLLFLVILLPILKEDQLEEDCKEKYIPKKENTNLWASFPGELNTTTNHTFGIFDYSANLNSSKVGKTINLEEKTKYDNFEFAENKIYFDAKSEFLLQDKVKNNIKANERINSINLGMFETFETLSNPPLYQKGINSIQYLLNKAFQKPEIFIKHIFTYYFFNFHVKYEERVLQTILKYVNETKARNILSKEEKYAKYSFKSVSGFYQWVKILGNSKEIYEAEWLIKLFDLTDEEINSIFGEEQYLYKEYIKYNEQLAKNYSCKNSICGNELIYSALIFEETLGKVTNSSLDSIYSLYKEINEDFYPFSKSPELFLYFKDFKKKINENNIEYKDYKISVKNLENLIGPTSQNSLLSANNSALFLSLVQTNNEEKISKIYQISLKQSKFLCDYFYEFLPQLFLYPEFEYEGKKLTLNPASKAFSTIAEKTIEKTYYKLLTTNNMYDFLLSKYVWLSLHYKLLNLSMEYDDEDICPLIMQHALDDGRKVLKICSDPVTAFKTPYELSKWFEPYYCVKGEKTDCDMRIINHLKSIVYITEDEIKGIYEQDNLGSLIEQNDKELKTAFNCKDKCTNEYLAKIQFWNSTVSKNLPTGFKTADSLNEVFPEVYPYPMELYYYAKKSGITYEIPENDINALISLSPKKDNPLLNEDNYETFNNKLAFEKNHTLYIEKGINFTNYEFIHILEKDLLFDTKINSEFENVEDLLQGRNTKEDKKNLEFLSNGEYYDNFKPGINKTTGFNFGINLVSGEKKNNEYDRYCISTEEGKNMRKILSINEFPFLNIKKVEYNYLINNYSYVNSPIFNFESLTGDNSFIDGFEYDHEQDVIYYYDKISSRPYKFTYSEELEYGDQTCRKYNLDKNDINNINEKDDLNTNKAFVSQKLNKPFVVSVEDEKEKDNYICVEPNTNMVLNSTINFVYSIYTKNYGFLNSKIENKKLYPIFTYNRNYKVDIDSFNEVFSEINSYKSFRNIFITLGVIFIIIFAILACFCFYKYCSTKKRINLNDLSQNLGINTTREPTTNTTS